MASISGSVVNTTFTYDANGNQTGGNGLTLTYASFNKPATIARGSALIAFAHDSEHQRYKQMNPAGETLYLAGSGVMAERSLGAGGVVQWTNLSLRRRDAAGAGVERLSYDAWGKRRFPNGQDDPSGSIASQTTRGFTGHEQLADVGLVHMNGRVYDPMLGRFGTPDPMTENPFSTQGWNRYSYVGNSPLNFTDPSGYCFLGCFWQKPFKALGKLLRRVPIIGQILTVAAGMICGPVCSSITSAVVTGLASGDLGLALKAGFISMATAVAMNVVGDLTGSLGLQGTLDPALKGHGPLAFPSEAHVFNMAGHAAVGCASSVASGSKCGPGALSGAVGSFATPLAEGLSIEAGLAVTAAAGGLASVAGGGKFGNGAVTAAFGYLYNRLDALDKQAKEILARLRSSSAQAEDIIKALENASKVWTLSIDASAICPFGSPACTQPYSGKIVVNPELVDRLEFQAADGHWFKRSIDVIVGHELAHGYIAQVITNPFYAINDQTYNNMAIKYENVIAKQIDPGAPTRQMSHTCCYRMAP